MKKIKTIFKLNLKKHTVYRGNFIMNTVFGVLPLIIQYFLWSAVYKYSNARTISGYNLMMMIQYFICVFFLKQITNPRQIARSISNDILSGDLNAYLIKPFGYLKMKFIEHISNRLVSISILLLPMAVYVAVFNRSMGIENIFLFIVFVANAFVGQFLIYCILGITVFWTEESSNLMDLWGMIGGVLSGAYIPFAVLPTQIRNVLLSLPFKYLVYYPINVLVQEKINYWEISISLIFSGVFLGILYETVIYMWKKGLRKYSAFGM